MHSPLAAGDAAGADARDPLALFQAQLASDSSAAIAETMQQLIDDLPEQIAILEQDGTILVANRAWTQIVRDYGYLDALPGGNYRAFCAAKAAEGYAPAALAVEALDEILSGNRSMWQLVYNGTERWSGHDYQITFHRIAVGRRMLVSVTRSDLTELLALRRFKDQYATSLIEGQALERQRVARELHDSTSQLLATVGLLLGRLRHQSPAEGADEVVDELQELLSEAQQEIRSISYLAHPPALERLGLAAAMRALVEGFGRRTSLETSFQIEGEAAELPSPTEGLIYRIAQEALSNVHRHARARKVRVSLSFRRSMTHLLIDDDGIGISADTLAGTGGVGIASMRSRLSEIGGRLSFRKLSPGTAILASIPAVEQVSDLPLAAAS